MRELYELHSCTKKSTILTIRTTKMTRLLFIYCIFSIAIGIPLASGEAKDSIAIDIADRRELFVDRYLVQELEGEARQILHHPVP